jgi:hypothetical protein
MIFKRRPRPEAGERTAAPAAADAWRPSLGVGFWRTVYAECCDAVLAYDRVVATLPAGALRVELAALRADLPALLDRARVLTELGATLDPAGPVRDPRLRDLLAEDPLDPNLVAQLPDEPPATLRLRDRVVAVRTELWGIADEAARLAVRLRENPAATDVVAWLDGLANGLAAARRAGWTPVGYS